MRFVPTQTTMLCTSHGWSLRSMAHPPTAWHRRYLPAWFASVRIREYSTCRVHWMMSSDSLVSCLNNPTLPSHRRASGIGKSSSPYASNLDPPEISLRMLGSPRSRLNSDANGSPPIAITPDSKDSNGDRHFEKFLSAHRAGRRLTHLP